MPEFLETTIDKFIFRVAMDCLYSGDGVWVLESGRDGRVRLGLSDYVQHRNGDAAFVHLKPIGTRLSSGDEFAELETIKATLSLISPLAINEAPHIDGISPWLENGPGIPTAFRLSFRRLANDRTVSPGRECTRRRYDDGQAFWSRSAGDCRGGRPCHCGGSRVEKIGP